MVKMKKILFILLCFLPLSLNAQNFLFGKPITTTLNSADKLVLYQSGSSKTFTVTTLSEYLNDSLNILRGELPLLWRGDIHDTAVVIRQEIADIATADTAWSRTAPNVTRLKYITDSVGIGNIAPTEKLEVTGNIKAVRAILDNGYDNILIGDSSGLSLTSAGLYNTFIGKYSGMSSSTADYNSFAGYNSGRGVTGSYNSIFGSGAGVASGAYLGSVLMGWNAGNGKTAGDYTVHIGGGAGDVSSGNGTIGIGYNASSGSTGDHGINIGYVSGRYNASLGFISIGGYCGENATSAAGSFFGGYYTGNAITTGDSNTFVGYRVSPLMQTGKNNSNFGCQAGYNSLGNSNIFIGNNAGFSYTSGSYNTGVGTNSLSQLLTTQNYNTSLGCFSGEYSVASGCVYLGYAAGQENVSDNKLFISNSNDDTPLIWGDFAADSIIINGDLRATGYAGGATAWTNESDRRLKKNITPISNPLDKVMALEGIQFEWIDQREPGKRIGLIAQDVEKVLPEVVNSGETYGIQYGPVVALLIEAIKEQQKEINELKSQLLKMK